MQWCESRVQRLDGLLREGKTYGQCADLLGVSRGSVASAVKTHIKHNIRSKHKPSRGRRTAPAHVWRPKAPRLPSVERVGDVKWTNDIVASPVASVLDLEHSHCRWPVEGGFCGHARGEHESYCSAHATRSRPKHDPYNNRPNHKQR